MTRDPERDRRMATDIAQHIGARVRNRHTGAYFTVVDVVRQKRTRGDVFRVVLDGGHGDVRVSVQSYGTNYEPAP
jgi:hypothetical protein